MQQPGSHDAEDVVLVLDGRPELADELANAVPELREDVGRALRRLLDDSYFVEGMEGYFERAVAGERAKRVIALMERFGQGG